MENKVYISIDTSANETRVHIRQFNNLNGITLKAAEFSSFMFQIKAIERSFLESMVAQNSVVMEHVNQQNDSVKENNNDLVEQSVMNEHIAVDTAELKKKRKVHQAASNSTKKKRNEEVMNAYCNVLLTHIDAIVASQCLGCLINVDNAHDVCPNRDANINTYFDSAMQMVDEKQMKVSGYKIPSKNVLITDLEWCEHVKDMMKLKL
jgi:hypothetical protein